MYENVYIWDLLSHPGSCKIITALQQTEGRLGTNDLKGETGKGGGALARKGEINADE